MKKLKLFFAALALLVGGANSASAQTDVTSTYLTNANFEGGYESQTKPQEGRDIYKPAGWTVTWENGEQNDLTSLNSSCTQWVNFKDRQQPTNGGNNTYWIRYRWGNSSKITLSQTTSSLPVGTYRLSADAINLNTNNATATISVAGKSVNVNNRNTWANYGVVFTLTEASTVTITYTYTQSAQAECIAGIDNFKLEDITQGASDITTQNWTSAIANSGFERGTSGEYGSGQNHVYIPIGFTMNCTMEGWRDGSINTTNPSEGSKLYNLWAGTTTSLDMYQSLSLPVGKYTISADLRTQDAKISDQGVYAKIGENVYKSGTIQTIGDPWDGVDAWNTLSKDFYVQSDGSVQIGASSTGGANSVGWFQIDNFQLSYKGAIQNTPYSIVQEEATAVTNDKWYAVEIPSDGNYRIVSSIDNTVKYTQDGYKIPSDISTSVNLTAGVKQVVALTAGTLYVQAASNANLTIKPDNYTYSVSSGTADKTYIQPGQTVTVSYTVSTNDSGATLDQDYSGVTFDEKQINVTPGASGFTFTVPANLTANTEHTLYIPAGAIGYDEGTTYNAEQSITLKTPAVFDGIFFIKQNDVDKYVSRGGNDNTEAILDSYGIPVQITTDAENVSLVKFVDNNRYLYAGSSSVYSDKELAAGGNNVKWTIASYSGGYSFYNSERGKYMAAGVGAEAPNVPAAIRADDAYAWILEATSAHPAKMQAVKDAQAAAAATAAGISASTQADLKTYLSENYGETPVAITGVPSVVDQFQKKADKGNGQKKTFMTETKIGLSHGLYRLRVNAFERIAGLDAVLSAGGAPGLAYVYANDQKIQLCSLAETYKAGSAWSSGSPADISKPEGYYVNNTTSADAAFDAGYYVNDVYIYLDTDDSSIEFGIETTNSYGATDNSQWICYNNFSLVKFDAKPTAEQKTALATAISKAEGKTLGFEDGEYAPYSNIDAIEKLAEAKAINPETASGAEVVTATNALNGATWTANDGEVNAFCGGDFTQYETVSGEDMPYGWNLYNGASNHSRIMGGTEGSSNTGLAATTSGKALLLKFNATYGESEGYTMPLKGGKLYKITFKHGRWAENNPRKTNVIMTDPNGTSITLAPGFQATNNDCQSNKNNWEDFTGYFIATTDGNYKFNFEKELRSGQNTQMQIAIGDIELKSSTDALEFVDGSAVPTYAPGTYPSVKITRNLTANKWATGVYPFAINKSAVGEIAVLARYNSEDAIIGFNNADNSTANVPFLMRSASDKSEITLSNVAVAAASATNAEAGDASLVGSYANNTDVTENAGNYILSNNTIYPVGENVTVNAYRAYINIAGINHARALRFVVGEITGVDNVAAATEATLKDGKYLENGKIVIVKNGQKFNANGQQVK